jgi:hypothetical protein
MNTDPATERLVLHAEAIAVASERMEVELRGQVGHLRKSLFRTRVLSVAMVLLAALGFLAYRHVADAQRVELRQVMCGGFVPISQQKPSRPSKLGDDITAWARAGVDRLDCLKPGSR